MTTFALQWSREDGFVVAIPADHKGAIPEEALALGELAARLQDNPTWASELASAFLAADKRAKGEMQ